MAKVTFSFNLPSTIDDTAGPTDWAGTIALASTDDDTLHSITGVSLVGSGASYFNLSYNMDFSVAFLTPVAAVKYENFASAQAANYAPGNVVFDLAVSVTFSDGSTLTSAEGGHVSLVAVDDDPPVNLHFTSGGTLAEGQAGAVIGTLLAEDHDPAFSGTLSYSLGNPVADSAYEVDGNVLRLKDGVSVDGAPGTTHSVAIVVSDGHVSKSYDLSYTMVAGPGTGGTTAPVVVTPGSSVTYPSGDIFDGTGSAGTGDSTSGDSTSGGGTVGGGIGSGSTGSDPASADDGLGPAPLSHGGHADASSGSIMPMSAVHHDLVWLA